MQWKAALDADDNTARRPDARFDPSLDPPFDACVGAASCRRASREIGSATPFEARASALACAAGFARIERNQDRRARTSASTDRMSV
ncbi:hypothetical protein WS71_01030 [Burkholderia mayonis]|uniref:Uncharacterized protein n=1 Tax=Burkholderia mayonis TaxID=1385591 RepID=A0A1B4FQX7_9BURK|nr:hypothetical protein WS71_01030 [Burkholderia mayonis]KVE56869.1 hypothetical protein WS71_02220 [Burkholderia mayonis]